MTDRSPREQSRGDLRLEPEVVSAPAGMVLPFSTLLRIALRTLFIQAGFSPEAMQTLGLLYALEPAWPHLYPQGEARAEAMRRHLTPFNTHPYAAAAIVGGILFYELRLANGQGTAEEDAWSPAVMLAVETKVAAVVLETHAGRGHARSQVMDDLRRGREDDSPPRLPHAHAQVHVFFVEEEALVEQPDGVDRAAAGE